MLTVSIPRTASSSLEVGGRRAGDELIPRRLVVVHPGLGDRGIPSGQRCDWARTPVSFSSSRWCSGFRSPQARPDSVSALRGHRSRTDDRHAVRRSRSRVRFGPWQNYSHSGQTFQPDTYLPPGKLGMGVVALSNIVSSKDSMIVLMVSLPEVVNDNYKHALTTTTNRHGQWSFIVG